MQCIKGSTLCNRCLRENTGETLPGTLQGNTTVNINRIEIWTLSTQEEAAFRSTSIPQHEPKMSKEDQTPPKYEDIQNYPIVNQHNLSIDSTNNNLPPRYEDINKASQEGD